MLLFVFTTYQGIGATLLGANAEINNNGLAISNMLPEISKNVNQSKNESSTHAWYKISQYNCKPELQIYSKLFG